MPISSKSRPRSGAPTKRALAKSRTRQKILASAKRLFAERGYEAATIRDIASEAGMSTGAVFASFTGKSDVFGEIILADRSASYEAMERVLAERLADPAASVDDVLTAMFESGYQFRLGDLPLMQATISASWSPDMGADVRERMAKRPVSDLIARALNAAIGNGKLSAEADVPLLSRMLWESYLGNYAHAVYDAWSLERLMDQLRRQVRIVLAGARTGFKS
ncbi:MAG: TetR family transcriptional regulator [Caulobacteraceae bacterium]